MAKTLIKMEEKKHVTNNERGNSYNRQNNNDDTIPNIQGMEFETAGFADKQVNNSGGESPLNETFKTNKKKKQIIAIAGSTDSPKASKKNSADNHHASNTSHQGNEAPSPAKEKTVLDIVNEREQKEGKNSMKDVAIWAWLKNVAPCYNKTLEKQQFKSGKDKVKSELCITRVMRKMRELDRLKCLLLTDDQRVIFDNLPNPDILAPLDIPNDL
eukprot:CAMPEP_0114575284 /NCGR_PEP_ID=MMETSP0125-20121206/172_1 /TAXON_ID=485358 ORGANISM="Aristerostoma sp., Strain ATCC 50986" /NCGR_SAMPLE_ID=MMETSP0125 /ASSEMBLY_ACC=CAM_ASM_000245 /LENGTH=213 /DNA_ID=CAMNT_0001762897 /DNA_START=1363 /DNA_END=2006 /DNA_ORIENTATION=+